MDHPGQDDRRALRLLERLGRAEPGRLAVGALTLDDRALQLAHVEDRAVSPRQAERVRRELDLARQLSPLRHGQVVQRAPGLEAALEEPVLGRDRGAGGGYVP